MTPAARLSAAIEIIETIDADRVPAAQALKAWGTAHRFAGSGDRAAISGLVWDVLRRRASSAWIMGEDTARARLLGMLRLERAMTPEAIATLCDGSRFAPQPLTEAERNALASKTLDGAPAHVAGDYPEWLDPYFAEVFGEDRAAFRLRVHRDPPSARQQRTPRLPPHFPQLLMHLHAHLALKSREQGNKGTRNQAVRHDPKQNG